MEYLLRNWKRIDEKLKAKHAFLFLDYDGTLIPIVATPQQAVIPRSTKTLLEKFSKNQKYKIAIISGRALKDIKEKVGLKNVIYVGNHGAEIEGPKIKFESPISPRCRAILEHIKTDLEKKLSSIKGTILEDKGLSLSVHFRLVDKSQIPQVKAIVHECAILYLVRSKIKIKSGKMVLEIRLPLEWDKGKVVLWLLARQKFAISEKSFIPIYIGDDKTDEDAFKALKNKGLTIFVGEPKPSHARYYLKNSREVTQFLERILDLKKA
jgi:trehalose-phosphatase